HRGRTQEFGAVDAVIDAYEKQFRALDGIQSPKPSRTESPSTDSSLISVSLGGDCRNGIIDTGQTLRVRIVARLGPAAIRDGVAVAVILNRTDNPKCHAVNSHMDGQEFFPLGGSEYGISLIVHDLPLLSGEYNLLVCLSHPNSVHFYDYWR